MKTIFFLSFILLLSGVYAQNDNEHKHKHIKIHANKNSTDSVVKIIDEFQRDDGNGGAIIIQRDRDDTLADKWLKEYIEVTRKTSINYLKGIKSSGCSNLDFEDGSFNNWTCQTGVNNGYPAGSWTGTAPVATRHTIVSGGTDPYGGFPMLAPNGGTYSVQLGNNNTGAEAEQLIYTFFVLAQDTNFIYKYAAVLEDPGHPPSDQPYFEMKIYDGHNNVIPCSYQQYVAGGSIPGFQSNGDVRYKPWTTVGINLGPYVGQTITVVATTADCSQGAHFGYAYLDFICPSSFTQTPNVYCNNVTSATLNIPDIDPGMTYQWSTGATTPSITINPQTYNGSSVNCYIQSPTSAGLCGFWYAFPIEVVNITPAFNSTSSCLTVNFTDASTINQGSITSWSWDFGDGTTSASQNPSHTYSNPGDYTVTLTVSSGTCSMTISQHVTTIAISLSTTFTNVSCNSANDGTATVTATGGNAPYTYTWNTTPPQHTQTATNMPPGTYTVAVSDNGGCPNTTTVIITQAPAAQSSMTHTDVTCFGMSNGTAAVSTSGGVPPFTVHWNNNQTDSSIISLGPGTYNVTLTDSHGCSIINLVTILQPPQISITATATPTTICAGFSSTLTASGAVGYMWDNGLGAGNPQTVTPPFTTTYHVTGTDANNCSATTSVTVTVNPSPTVFITGNNTICQSQCTTLTGNGGVSYVWETGPNTISISVCPLSTTSYHVTGTDANGCVDSASYQVNVIPMPIANAGNDTAVCGLSYTLNATPSVGTGIWTSPDNITINAPNNPQSTISATHTGVYTLIWTEDNTHGCIDADTVVIQLTQIPTSTFTADTIPCAGNSSTITFTGFSEANSSFLWNWDSGNATPGSGIGPHQVTWSTTGVHTVTLSVSTNGCQSPTTSVLIYNPAPLTTSLSKTDVLCHGDTTGAVNLTVTGGRVPYTYHWNNSNTTEDLTNIGGGIYTVNVTDFSGCIQNNGITVNEPTQLIISLSPAQYICMSQPAYLSITATGGTPPYNFYWNNQPSNSTIAVYPDTTTTYSAYVVDANGCTSPILTTTVYVAPRIHVNLLANTNHVCPGDPVMLTTVIWGGVGPPYIIYNQDGNVVTPPIYIYPNHTGYYTVRVEDACGTWDTAGVYIYVWPLPPANALADTLQGCVPLTVQFNEVNPDSGQTYLWDFGDQSNLSLSKNPIHTYTTSGTFTVTITVTSIHGCKYTKVYNDMITVWPKPNAAFIYSPEVVTEIEPVVDFTNHSTGAAWYEWMFGDGDSSSVLNPEHRYPGAGDYEVLLVAVSNKGCLDTAKVLLKVLEQYTFYAPTAFSPDGDRTNDFFYALAHGIKEQGFKLEVYDRWGEVIWSTTVYSKIDEHSEKWDGKAKNHKIVPIGTYTWRAVFKDDMNRDHEKVGAVTVIR